MAIIPQDAFLFDDSLLRNLDPKDSYTSVEVNDVIEKCHLTKVVQELGKMKQKFTKEIAKFVKYVYSINKLMTSLELVH